VQMTSVRFKQLCQVLSFAQDVASALREIRPLFRISLVGELNYDASRSASL